MTIHNSFSQALAVIALAAGVHTPTRAATFRVISNLGAYSQPIGIAEGSEGVFYSASGQPPCAFSVTTHGKLTDLGCPSGASAMASPLVAADDQRLYSMWFATNLPGKPQVPFSVNGKAASEQDYPQQSLQVMLSAALPDGTLAGWGGTQTDAVYLVTMDTQGNVHPIIQFPNNDLPSNVVTYGSDGNFYGTAQSFHNVQNYSYVYQITPAGVFTKLYSFPGNDFGGVTDFFPLVQATDGNFYGVTAYGGTNGGGTFYKITATGQYTLLYGGFGKLGAATRPHFLIQASDGNFYGATYGSGGDTGIFQLTPVGQFTLIHKMSIGEGQCQCQLMQGSDGIIYGIAITGGSSGGGSFFAVDAHLPKPAPQALAFTPRAGPAHTKVMIWGYNLLGATVQFNGTSAVTIKGSGPNYVWAHVPPGATSGPITVTTPGGVSATTGNFTVSSAKNTK